MEMMKLPLDGFTFRPIVRDLNEKILGGRIDKISQPNKSTIVLSIRQPGQNFYLQISTSNPNSAAFLIKNPIENPAEPPIFCMVLRKQIENGKIGSIRQNGRDRLIFIDIDTIGAGGMISTKTLACEFMGKYSNIILIEEGLILDALKKIGSHQSRVRMILPGHQYQLPPANPKIDLDSSNWFEELSQKNSESTLQKFLIDHIAGFGTPSAIEVCRIAELDPNSKLFERDLPTIKIALEKYRDRIETIDLDSLFDWAKFFYTPPEPPERDQFSKIIRREISRCKNKIVKLEKELESAENSEIWKIKADNLLTYQNQFKNRADRSVTVQNIYDGKPIEIFLDQRLTIAENVQNLYKKYDKLKRGQNFIAEQISECRREIDYLESIETSLETSQNLSELDDVRRELESGGYIPKKKVTAQKKSTPLTFKTEEGMEILVGKNNSQNDRLTFKIASPNDFWFHTKEIPGSHVILRCGNSEPSDESILYAARIAAGFSKASDSSNVPVDYTRVKFLKKPNGSKPGFVIFTHQKTILVDPFKPIHLNSGDFL